MSRLSSLAKIINQSQNKLSVESKFLHDLNKTIEALDDSHQPSKTYKPSSLGGCIRNIYFQITGASLDISNTDAGLEGICESGTDRHVRIQTWISRMKEAGYDCEWVDVEEYLKNYPVDGTRVSEKSGMETHCKNDILNLSFMADGIIKYHGEFYIVEIKTESVYKYQSQTEPFADHIVQASCYSVALGIDKVIFIYEDRNLCNKKAYLVNVTDEMKENLVVNKIEQVENYVRKEKVPPKTDNLKDCNYCKYKGVCKLY